MGILQPPAATIPTSKHTVLYGLPKEITKQSKTRLGKAKFFFFFASGWYYISETPEFGANAEFPSFFVAPQKK